MSTTSTRPPIPEVPGTGHRAAGQAPEGVLVALTEFVAPYREGGGGLR